MLSPSDAPSGEAPLRGCGEYLVVTMRVRRDRLFPRAVRLLRDLGARLDYVDEEQRRIAADVPASRLGELARLAGEYGDYASVTVKASCRADPGALEAMLRGLGFSRASRGPALVLLGVWEGRVVEAEIRGSRARFKVGARVRGRPRPPLPPGLYTLAVEEAGEALEALRDLLARLGGRRV
ncbi:MAG: hypothetical protein GSR80_001138 [Desulfurococcales archaeon]|nr:hypothetical protein [Desulfurococcales archaeon]